MPCYILRSSNLPLRSPLSPSPPFSTPMPYGESKKEAGNHGVICEDELSGKYDTFDYLAEQRWGPVLGASILAHDAEVFRVRCYLLLDAKGKLEGGTELGASSKDDVVHGIRRMPWR